MKKWLLLVIMAAVIFTVSGVGIGEKVKETEKPTIMKRAPRPTGSQTEEMRKMARPGRGRQPISPEERAKRSKKQQVAQLKRIQEGPTALIQNLNVIKKVAEKEKATETVAALDKLIADTQQKMEKSVKSFKDRQAKHQEMMEKSRKRGEKQGRPSGPPRKNGKSGRTRPDRTRPTKDTATETDKD